MSTLKTSPYGTWESPITADLIVSDSVGLDAITINGADVCWLETRPNENGRGVIVKRAADGKTSDITPPGFHVGTRVHEYGGGAYVVSNSTVYFCNHPDQRIYRQDPNTAPIPLTPEPSVASSMRFGDLIVDHLRKRLIAVLEDHSEGGQQPINCLASIPVDGSGQIKIIARGHDFYSSPRLSKNCSKLAWLSWDHPNMPWDGTELTMADCNSEGGLANYRVIAGGISESIFQPEWSPNGDLFFVSDRTDWWNLYRYKNGQVEAICPSEAEFARAQWSFGMSTYTLQSDHFLICTYNRGAIWKLARLNLTSGQLDEIQTDYTDISSPKIRGNQVIFQGASPGSLPAIIALDLDTGECRPLRTSSAVCLDSMTVSRPKIIEFPTTEGATAHAFYYAPKNVNCQSPIEEKPPLLVKSHGGPTGSLSSGLNLETQFWTSRGFAVVDVNYRGSTGYGRKYRESLYGQWGVFDVDDCANAASYLVANGLADPERLLISGRSASGLTSLCALTFKNIFRGGASRYGISDLVALVADTHKFELRVCDRLVGPYPERKDIYAARSPINHVDRISRPIVFFQGEQDQVVPLSQTQAMVDALRKKQIPVACLIFKDERHGFRKAENIKRALESELSFYSQILAFKPADDIPLMPIL